MTEEYTAHSTGFRYRVGSCFAHVDSPSPVYARVDGFDQEKDAVLFSVWEVARPGWQGGAGLPSGDFAQLYHDGPYPQLYVDRATEEYWFEAVPQDGSTPMQEQLLIILLGCGHSLAEAELIIRMVLLEHRRQLVADLDRLHDSLNKHSPTRRGLKLAEHRIQQWKMSPAHPAPEGDQKTT